MDSLNASKDCCQVQSADSKADECNDGSPSAEHDNKQLAANQVYANENWIRKLVRNITVEPMLFLKMVAEGNFVVVADTLEIERICTVTFNHTAEDCRNMDSGNHSDMQTKVQIFQNEFNYHQTLMDSIIPVLLVLIFGSLSDRYGRKPAMISVLLGFVLLGLVYTLMSIRTEWPVEILYLGTLLVDLGGTWVVFNMAIYSYLSDITTVGVRTKRMGWVNAIWYLGFPLGTLLGGWLFKGFGYVVVFSTSTILWTICVLYTAYFVKESSQFQQSQENNTIIQGSFFGQFKHSFTLYYTLFKKLKREIKTHILVLFGLKLGVFMAQGHQVYQWARKVLQWDATQYSTWSSFDNILHQIGMVGFVWVAERLIWHNCTVVGAGLISIMFWSIILACATGPTLWWLTVLASLAGIFEPAIEPAILSMLTAIVGIGEEGKLLALLGILESLWLSIERALFTNLYNYFINTFTQINFVVQTLVAFILSLIVLWLKRRLKLHSKNTTE